MSTQDPVGEREIAVRLVVGPDDSASRWGNAGLDVLSTPSILGHMEAACVRLVEPGLRPGEMTVGTGVQMRHLHPVPVGAHVDIRVRLTEPGRRMRLSFEVTDAAGRLVSTGSHDRAVVRVADFVARLGS